MVTLTALLVPPAAAGDHDVVLTAKVGVAAAAAWLTAMVLGEPVVPEGAVAVTVTVALRAAPLLAAAVMVNDPGVLPLAEDTVSQVWLEDTV